MNHPTMANKLLNDHNVWLMIARMEKKGDKVIIPLKIGKPKLRKFTPYHNIREMAKLIKHNKKIYRYVKRAFNNCMKLRKPSRRWSHPNNLTFILAIYIIYLMAYIAGLCKCYSIL